jgi:hypothetical protein
MTTIAQNTELLKNLFTLLEAHRGAFAQERTYVRVMGLLLAEVFVFARHTVSQLLMCLGQTEVDWSAAYRVFSQRRFRAERVRTVLIRETLKHVKPDALYVVGVDATHTPRSSRKLEGCGWARHPATPVFRPGIHQAQRWSHGSWLTPAQVGYSRAIPIWFQPAFSATARRQVTAPCTEGEAAGDFLFELRGQLNSQNRAAQTVLALGDGHYDELSLWRSLPEQTCLLARTAKNRALYELPPAPSGGRGRRRLYGPRAATPQAVWGERTGWQALTLQVRGRERHLQVKVCGPFLRRGAPHCPLLLMVVRGKDNARTRREPLPFLVNARQNAQGSWELPLPLETLLFWAWQRWELEVCHRELKSNFGLGQKQCFNPYSAVASVQWSAWVYAMLVLAGYRTFGLTRSRTVPTAWWRGSGRWSLNTLWRSYRSALWQVSEFQALPTTSPADWGEKEALLRALRNAVFAATAA